MRYALIVVVVLASGCTRHQKCLRGTPHVGRAATDEAYGLVRREWQRAHAGGPAVVRARILERVPAYVPDASDLANEPTCAPEMVGRFASQLDDGTPVEYSRMLVARVRAAGQVHDTTDVMTAKAAFLISVIKLRDSELTAYKLAPDEPGPPPDKAFLRYLALYQLARSNTYVNTGIARDFAGHRLVASTDDREQLLMSWWARQYVDPHLGDDDPDLRPGWIADIRRRLHGAPDPIGVEIALVYLDLLGARPGRYEREIRALCEEIIAAGGRLSLARGIPGADRDLARAALATRDDLAHRKSGGWIPPLPAVRVPFSPGDWLDGEPAGGRVSAADAAKRLQDLDGELARAQRNTARCIVLREIPRWVQPADADRRFAAMIAPVFDGTKIRFSNEVLCRITAALAIEGVAPGRRSKFLLTMLGAENVLPFDASGDTGDGFTVSRTDRLAIAQTAARALAEHPRWLDDSIDLRNAVTAIAMAAPSTEAQHAELEGVLEPAIEHLLRGPDGVAIDSALPSGALRAPAKPGLAIAKGWLGTIKATAERKEVHSTYAVETLAARMLALSEVAPALGLAAEARAILGDVATLPLPSPSAIYTHQVVVRAAVIARGMLDLNP